MVKPILTAFVLAALTLSSPSIAQKANTVQTVGNTGVSGQMMFLQSNGQVAILDKVENNPAKRPGSTAPAYAVFYNYDSNTFQSATVRSNTFCAGGAMLGDGRWIVTGGNKAVSTGGVSGSSGKAPYYTYNGGKALRFLSPCSGASCSWTDQSSNQMIKERWYPWVEPMRDGYAMIAGGMRNGGFVASAAYGNNEPSYEFYPNAGGVYQMPLLTRALPLNLYPIMFLMADNRIFVAAKQEAILWNTDNLKETKLNTVPVVPRNYPSNGGAAMLPMTPDDNYAQTIIFCGGLDVGSASNWGNEVGPKVMLTQRPASKSCATITPLQSPAWTKVDDLPEGRSMGQFINLPDGTLWFAMGVTTGAAGYTTDPNSPGKPVGFSFGDNPSYTPLIYNPNNPAGQRWTSSGKMNVARLYHSAATLLPDSSILLSGSNPNPDVTKNVKWKTEYRAERWYPSYYDQPRPSNDGLPSALGYGGAGFTLTMNNENDAQNTKVVIIRTGFSTHGYSMGQRMIQLRTAVVGNQVNVAAMPANPAIFAPGTALAFIVVNGVPSMGKFITIGNGKLGQQPVGPETVLTTRKRKARKASKRARSSGLEDYLAHFDDGLRRRDQVSSLQGADLNRAIALAEALNGTPVKGVALGTSADSMYHKVNETTQAMVEGTVDAFQSGLRTDHLSG